ncbi:MULTISPECIES: hypothetical protein [Faecalibacterium]|uniref:hypothetical protein n=1 Tax=Faecalibacterium TaxID=216851 RepID=UPI0015CF0DAE|nr:MULTISPECIES: hypothetical protein [Faecalibacterium]MCC2122244.1 hypothetical protein [Faecalibacterium hominis (ex Afrizal et al. 2022)]
MKRAAFSVESNHREFAEGNDEATEEEKEVQRKFDKPDTRRKMRNGKINCGFKKKRFG